MSNPTSYALPVDSKPVLRVPSDGRSAILSATAPQNGGSSLTAEAVMLALEENGITFGIDQTAITQIINTSDYGRQEVVARAKPPAKGKDAELEYHFSAERELRPRELEDGSVDFKDLGLVVNLGIGDLLVTKHPPQPGTPGVNIFGKNIPAPPGRDVAMPAGPGTKISEDGLSLLAAIEGQANIVKNRVTVSNLLTIDSDIGVATGNIDFVGNVKVRGNVSKGFKVKATGSVTIHGILDGGTIESGGHVSIDNGFNGTGQGEIIAGGDVRCKFFQNGKVSARGSIYTGAIIGCTVRSGDRLDVSGSRSRIYNSSLSARNVVSCVNVGTEGASNPVTIEVGSDPELIVRKAANPKEIAEVQKRIRSIEQVYKVLADRAKKGALPPDKLMDFEKVKSSYAGLKTAYESLMLEKSEIEESMATMGFGTVIVTGNIREGTQIVIGAERYTASSDDKFVRYKRDPEKGIVSMVAK